jgi:hypothetical protein
VRYQACAAVILVSTVLLAGCGSSGSSKTTSRKTKRPAEASAPAAVIHGWKGFGAPLMAFATLHPMSSGGPCTSGCYGSPESHAQGALWQFTSLNSAGPDDRVIGYDQAFPVGTPIAAAERGVLALMPAGTHPVGALVVEHSSTGSCGLWNLQSARLAKWFADPKIGDPKGQVGVEFNEVASNYEYVYKPSDVTGATVNIAPATTAAGC